MLTYNLTEDQKELLIRVVGVIREKKVENDFLCSFDMQGAEIIGIEGRFHPTLKPNLIALEKADLVILEDIGYYDLRFSVKQAGFDAVDSQFVAPVLPSQGISIGAVIYEMTGGNVQAVGSAFHTEIQQIVNDPARLAAEIEEQLNKLIDELRSDLPRRQQSEYLIIAEQFKEEMISENPEPSKLQGLLKSLAFLGDVEGTISLVSRAWPYLYPLVVLAAERISQSG